MLVGANDGTPLIEEKSLLQTVTTDYQDKGPMLLAKILVERNDF